MFPDSDIWNSTRHSGTIAGGSVMMSTSYTLSWGTPNVTHPLVLLFSFCQCWFIWKSNIVGGRNKAFAFIADCFQIRIRRIPHGIQGQSLEDQLFRQHPTPCDKADLFLCRSLLNCNKSFTYLKVWNTLCISEYLSQRYACILECLH